MIYVVAEEFIPRAHEIEMNRDLATLGSVAGFTAMMVFDVSLS